MKVLAWTPELSVEEYPPPPIPKEWVFGKVISAMISSLDKSFKVGLPTPVGRVAGSYGVLRVLENGVGSGAAEGKIYGVIPYSKEGVLGIDINGLMSVYASVPSDSLINLEGKVLSESSEMLPLWLEFSFIPHLKEIIKESENPLILGCNFMTYVIAANLRNEKEITAGCISKDLLKLMSELGVKVVNISKTSGGSFDFVVLGVLSSYYLMNVFNYLRSDGEVRIYLPPNATAVVLKLPDTARKAIIQRAKLGDPREGFKALSNIQEDILKKNIAVAKDLREVIHLIGYYPRILWVATS